MKVFILLCCTFAIVYAETLEEFRASVKAAFAKGLEQCNKIVKPTEAKCLFFCMVQELKLMKADGTVDKATLLKITDRIKKISADISAKVQAAFDACIAKVKKEKDKCVYALDLQNCYADEQQSKGIPGIFVR